MLRLACVALISAWILTGTRPGADQSAQRDPADDASVVKAAIASVSDGRGGHPKAEPLPFLSQSVAVCPERHDETCITSATIERFRPAKIETLGYSDSAGPQPGDAIPSTAARDELIAAAISRNRERHAWTGLSLPSFILIPASEEQNVLVRDRDRSKYAAFSLPAYSSDNHALVYGFYACGARCGTAWLFLLQRSEAEWRVQSRYMLGVR